MKKTNKMLLDEEIHKWKTDKQNKEILSQINKDFIEDYFKTLLINFPKDSSWLHHLGNDKFSCVSSGKWPSFSDSPIKTNEIISINLIDQQDDDELWNDDDDEKNAKLVDTLNVVVDCKKCFSVQDLKELAKKYLQFGKWIITHNTHELTENFGDSFYENLELVVGPNWKAFDRELKVIVSFINIPDDTINLKNINLSNEAKQNENIENTYFCSYYFYNDEELLNLFNQCQNCQWPYVNECETLELTNKDVCTYQVPNEPLKGYMCNISAFSLAELYHRYKNALFSGNIRYFITKGKGVRDVNKGIKDTIHDEKQRGMFYFYNNGITFISPSVKIDGKKITLDKFSIVNGGQTTYIIGNEKLEGDFSVPCKILEIKCDVSSSLKDRNPEKYKENLTLWLKHAGNISYALNSQKPVATKDLITNKLCVRNLKQYYNSSPKREIIFLTKAGEETFLAYEQKEKLIKLEMYLSLVHCFYLQLPGFAKNQKSKMYQKENIKRVIGQDDDKECKKMFSPSQLYQVNIAKKQIDKVVNKISRSLKKNPDLYSDNEKDQIALLKHCKNVLLSLYGLAYMSTIDSDVLDLYSNSKFFFNEFNKKYSHLIDLNKEIFNEDGLLDPAIWEESIKKLLNYVIYPAFVKWNNYKASQSAVGTAINQRSFSINDDAYCQYTTEEFKHLLNTDRKKWNRIFIDLIDVE